MFSKLIVARCEVKKIQPILIQLIHTGCSSSPRVEMIMKLAFLCTSAYFSKAGQWFTGKLIVHNLLSQIDMVEIKEVYPKMHQLSLADDVHKYCTEDDVKSILLSLIKGTEYVFTIVKVSVVSVCVWNLVILSIFTILMHVLLFPFH